MKDLNETLPGIERIKLRFLDLLQSRQGAIAQCALTAWEASDPDVVRNQLSEAQGILHQIAGSAGSLGFASLGQIARDCEGDIIQYVSHAHQTPVPVCVEVMESLDRFVSASQDLLQDAAQ
ncbi:hypothetical protein Z946_2623 [Sulfitobacter noctilucicola]|uniref:HPt (Histidine-containing phosphotransfer) domain-containing protein n=1 Tax=Sulfitobacter noctilucicola TaxID=1342301 RepID=A0A7W6Q6E5_9RHOB|nr:Hpt domain-containing protein [Sulfitobacter noctilucicola]KIN63749.1 hypothetical protein Z946_2623 [Sulfitobacter noctilucicola]MBB4174742.1 HPt (histidine-containing phosphotransfer) domain-containing protein [Sulfitobacter noctilucicola]